MMTQTLLLSVAALPALAAAVVQVRSMSGDAALRLVTRAVLLALLATIGVASAAAMGATGQDSAGAAVALLTLFVAAIVLGFSGRYMKADPRLESYAARIGWLIAAVLVFLAAADVISLAAAWVASGALLARLIGHVPSWVEAEAAARRARRAFLIGDSALLLALALLAAGTDSLSIAAIVAAAPALSGPVVGTALALLLVAAVSRSAVPPFHKWLMGSMTAPTPISALMHAGLVNAGGFLLIRFAPVLEAAPAIKLAAVALGAFGALFGTGVMLVRPDVKRALGGSTVAQMGFMVMSCGLGAYAAALWHLIAHGLFKAWLFLGSGSTVTRGRASADGSISPASLIMTIGTAFAV